MVGWWGEILQSTPVVPFIVDGVSRRIHSLLMPRALAAKLIATAKAIAEWIPEGIDPAYGIRDRGRCKVFLSQVLEAAFVSADELEANLPALVQGGLVHFCRCDLVECFDPESVSASKVKYLGIADYHMIEVM